MCTPDDKDTDVSPLSSGPSKEEEENPGREGDDDDARAGRPGATFLLDDPQHSCGMYMCACCVSRCVCWKR